MSESDRIELGERLSHRKYTIEYDAFISGKDWLGREHKALYITVSVDGVVIEQHISDINPGNEESVSAAGRIKSQHVEKNLWLALLSATSNIVAESACMKASVETLKMPTVRRVLTFYKKSKSVISTGA